MQDFELQEQCKCFANAKKLDYKQVPKNATFARDDTNTHHNPVASENNCDNVVCVSTCDDRPMNALSSWSFLSLFYLASSVTSKILIQNPTIAVSTSSLSCIGSVIFCCCASAEVCYPVDHIPHYNRRKAAKSMIAENDTPETSNIVIVEQPVRCSNPLCRNY